MVWLGELPRASCHSDRPSQGVEESRERQRDPSAALGMTSGARPERAKRVEWARDDITNKIMKFKAVIFDMDGVIIDSEFYWAKAEMGFLDKYKIKLSRELTAQMTGQSFKENALFLKQHFGLSDSVEEILAGRLEATEAIYSYQAGAMPGVNELITRIRAQDMKTAIASGATLDRIEMIVDRFKWRSLFDILVSTDHVNFVGKPDPAIYNHTVKVLGLLPEECVVIEDSVNGLRSAQGAGIQCIAVPDPRWSYGDFSAADLIVESLEDTKLFEFLGI